MKMDRSTELQYEICLYTKCIENQQIFSEEIRVAIVFTVRYFSVKDFYLDVGYTNTT